VVKQSFLLLDEKADLIGVFLHFGLAVLLNAVGDGDFDLVIFEHMGGGRLLKALEALNDSTFWSKEDLNFGSAGKVLLLADSFQKDFQKVSALLHKVFFLVAVELLSRHWWYIQARIPGKKHLVKEQKLTISSSNIDFSIAVAAFDVVNDKLLAAHSSSTFLELLAHDLQIEISIISFDIVYQSKGADLRSVFIAVAPFMFLIVGHFNFTLVCHTHVLISLVSLVSEI